MKFDRVHSKGQARLFENEFLEALTKAHPLVIWGMYTPIIILSLYHSSLNLGFPRLQIVVIFLSGLFFWSLFEYFAHRFLFHYEPASEKGKRVVYILHGNHHQYPRDKQRLFMPPLPSILLASTIFGMMYLFMRQYAFIFFPGFMMGYLLYGSMHYAIHAWTPPFRWMRGLWRNHHLHHYKNEHLAFGVSSTLWDHVFGTMFDLKNEKDDEEKVSEIMYK
jgi:sterol desaturase/sphingolipid hydroxylase (fatty acid hydroxylase superfamily)